MKSIKTLVNLIGLILFFEFLNPCIGQNYSNLSVDTTEAKTDSTAMNKINHKGLSSFVGTGIYYALFLPQKNELKKFLNEIYGINFPNQINSVGLIREFRLVLNREYIYDASLSFNYVIPIKSNFNQADFFRLSGYSWGFMIYGRDILYKNKRIDCVFGGGFNQGAYIIRIDDNQLASKHKNRFFAPKIINETGVLIKKVYLGLRTEYQQDISNKSWKSKSNVEMINSSFSGFNVRLVIGLKYGTFQKNANKNL